MALSAVAASDKMTLAAINAGSSMKDVALKRKPKLTHEMLDRAFVASLVLAALKSGQAKTFLRDFLWGIKNFPNHYTPQFDWKKRPMNRFVAVSVWLTGVYFLIKTYVVEKSMSKDNAVNMAHKKYKAHKNLWAVALHGAGSSLEMSIGCLACCYPKTPIYTKIASALAINNILTGFVLTPGVFGIKHLTVPGFSLFGVLRAVEILRTLAYDHRNYPQAWVLLQVGTVVRLLGYWILPFSSIDGRRGDLFTEPTMYSFNILLSGYLTTAFVYPPKWLLVSLLCYASWYKVQPPKISMKRRLGYLDAEERNSTQPAVNGGA
jgi:hypothetical protein